MLKLIENKVEAWTLTQKEDVEEGQASVVFGPQVPNYQGYRCFIDGFLSNMMVLFSIA